MRSAKIFAMMFALLLAVFCFSAPLANAGDEHPWDEESPVSGGTNSVPTSGNTGSGSSTLPDGCTSVITSSNYYVALTSLQFVILYHTLPNYEERTENEVEGPIVKGETVK